MLHRYRRQFIQETVEALLAGDLTGDSVAEAVYDLEESLRTRWLVADFMDLCRKLNLSTKNLEAALTQRALAYHERRGPAARQVGSDHETHPRPGGPTGRDRGN